MVDFGKAIARGHNEAIEKLVAEGKTMQEAEAILAQRRADAIAKMDAEREANRAKEAADEAGLVKAEADVPEALKGLGKIWCKDGKRRLYLDADKVLDVLPLGDMSKSKRWNLRSGLYGCYYDLDSRKVVGTTSLAAEIEKLAK